MTTLPVFDVWVCQGRMCTAHGSDKVAVEARQHADAARCRVMRGGCYGLCEIGANVVVRRFAAADLTRSDTPDAAADRLTLTHADNETVYSRMTPADMRAVLHAHLTEDQAVDALTRAAREAALPPESDVAARIRALRERRSR